MGLMTKKLTLLIILTALFTACAAQRDSSGLPTEEEPGMSNTLALTSPAFTEGAPIPSKYTCDGSNVSSRLDWLDAPGGTESYTLIVTDPDASSGDFVHWLLYNIPASARSLPEGVPTDSTFEDGSMNGKNGFGNIGYGGPCPPAKHRYFFKLYALDTSLNAKPGASKKEILKLMEGHILAEGQLMGTYAR
jgi:Raf kinase inhibitor-like YbhB/YbcL family protein